MANDKRKLTLFLYVREKQVKRILEIPEFNEPVDIDIIQSINGFRETLFEGRIDVNSSNQNEAQIDDDEFEANLQGQIEDFEEYQEEVKIQKEIENEFEEAVEAEDEKGRQKAARLAEEERKRLAEMKKAEEEKRIKKQTTVSTKKSTR